MSTQNSTTSPSYWVDLAASARLPNLPTVWSNIIASWFLGMVLFSGGSWQRWDTIFVLLPIASLLYLAGTFGNDWMDHLWDAKNKPHRAVPSGRIKRPLLGILALLCLSFGILLSLHFLSTQSTIVSITISIVVILYTITHKKTKWAIFFMALSRMLLPILSLSATLAPHTSDAATSSSNLEVSLHSIGEFFATRPFSTSFLLLSHPISLFLWTLAISIAARNEASTHHSIGKLPLVLFGIAATLALGTGAAYFYLNLLTPFNLTTYLTSLLYFLPALFFVGLWIFFAWHQHHKMKIFVPRMLAGFCLVDLLSIAPVAPSMAVLMLLLFLFAWALQRLAPAS